MEISSLSLSLSLSLSPTTLSLPSFHNHKPALSSSIFLNRTTTLFASTRRALTAPTRPGNLARKRFSCNSLFGLGVPELAVIAGVAALVFGPKQLPEVGRTFGKTIKSFQQAAKEFEQELKKPEEAESSDKAIEEKPASDNSEEKENAVSSSNNSS